MKKQFRPINSEFYATGKQNGLVNYALISTPNSSKQI